MTNNLLLNGASGFRFTRPTIGRIGATDQLHPHAAAAIDALAARVEAGFPAPPARAAERVEELEAIAKARSREARDAQSKSDRAARAVDEAYEEHAKAEDVAQRRAAEYDEARTNPQSSTETGSTDAHIAELKKIRDAARRAADRAAKSYEATKRDADLLESKARDAADAADEAQTRALEARQNLRAAWDVASDVLSLGIFSRDPHAGTFLSFPQDPAHVPLSQLIDRFGYTAEFYEVRRLIQTNAKRLSFNLRNLLSRDEVVEYMFVRALLVDGLEEAEGIFNSIVDEDRGGRLLYDFVIEYALVQMRDDQRMAISDATLAAMIQRLTDEPVLLRRDPLDAALKSVAAEFVYGDAELALVLEAERVLGIDIPARLQPALVDYIRRTNAEGEQINAQNAPYFISIALAKLQKENVAMRPAAYGAEVGVEDYSVSYYEDRITAPEYERASIEAAAQMYLSMVWGDMLGIFDTVDRIAMQSSGNGQPLLLEVRSRELANDLRTYVLDDEWRDLKTGETRKRINPTERQMMYRQLFGIGDAQVIDDAHVNPDFQRYWAVLMMEVVKYIGKVEDSGDNFSSISASKVYQAIEDLQYNLSAYCTGLPKIAAPTIYGELDFVIQRILDSTDVKQQLGRRGSPSFWKVVEQVRGMQDFTPLRNKGMFGHKILSTIAQATPAFVEDQAAFEEFIANVEAFIVAEDQLAEAGGSMAGLQFPGFFGFDGMGAGAGTGSGGGYLPPGMPSGLPGMPSGLPGMPGGMYGGGNGNTRANGSAPAEEWNF